MEKVRITRVSVKDTDKDGNKLKDKRGYPYLRVGIQTDRYGEKWLSTFAKNADSPEAKLTAGDEVNISVEQKGEFLNFRLPTKTDLLEERVYALEHKVEVLSRQTTAVPAATAKIPGTDKPYPSGPSLDDMPW